MGKISLTFQQTSDFISDGSIYTIHQPGYPLLSNHLPLVGKRHTELIQAESRQHAETHGQRLLRSKGARNAAASEDDAGEEREFDAVGLAVLQAITAEGVEGTDGATGGQRGDGARAHVARDATAGSQRGENVSDLTVSLAC